MNMTTEQDQQSSAELLPCPFCGDKPAVIPSHDADGCFWSWVQCGQCGARTQGAWVSDRADTCPIFYEGVREEWSRRAPAEQAARALPAGIVPVALVDHSMPNCIGWGSGDCPPDGTHLFTAAQVLAMGRVPPGWQALMKEARDNCMASIAEVGVSDSRIQYRKELLVRLDAALAAPRPQAAQEVEPVVIQQLTTEQIRKW